MNEFVDLNVSDPKLAGFAQSLGWGNVVTARVVEVRSFKDVPQKKQTRSDGRPGERAELVIIEGRDTELIRQAAAKSGVDLVNPTKTAEYYRDDGLIRAVKAAGKTFEIPVSPLILNVAFAFRARNLTQLRQFLAKCRKLGAPFILTSRARSVFDLKSPRETAAIATLLGLTKEQAVFSITKTPQRILDSL